MATFLSLSLAGNFCLIEKRPPAPGSSRADAHYYAQTSWITTRPTCCSRAWLSHFQLNDTHARARSNRLANTSQLSHFLLARNTAARAKWTSERESSCQPLTWGPRKKWTRQVNSSWPLEAARQVARNMCNMRAGRPTEEPVRFLWRSAERERARERERREFFPFLSRNLLS